MNTPFNTWLRGAMIPAMLAACSTGVGNPPASGPSPGVSIDDVYAQSLYQSAMYEARNVLPLFPAIADAEGMVRVVSIKADEWPWRDTTLAAELWVTVVPEVRDSCDDWAADEQVTRMRELLGLQPTYVPAYVIEMRVPADSMFRPTTNPAIDTRTLCDTSVDADCALHFPLDVEARHVRWIADQMLSSWKMPNGYPGTGPGDWRQLGYPWTRLGYTYNWHPGSPRYGASEYVVRKGTLARVTGVHTIQDYCRPI